MPWTGNVWEILPGLKFARYQNFQVFPCFGKILTLVFKGNATNQCAGQSNIPTNATDQCNCQQHIPTSTADQCPGQQHIPTNTTTSDVDFFDSSFTFYNESIQVSCCGRDKTVTTKTCGLGASCIGQCSAIDASLCLSGNCTGNPEDCRLGQEAKLNRKKRSSQTGSSSDYRWCYPDCRVAKHPSCCFNPHCKSIRPKRCKYLNYFTGKLYLCGLFFNSIQTTMFQATPAPNQAAFPMATGAVRCRKSPFRTPQSWTEAPTPILVSRKKLL